MTLAPATLEILSQVEKVSGVRAELVPDPTLPVLATVSMAKGNIPAHIVKYNPNKRGIDYNIAYECCFILRLFANEPEERFEFATNESARRAVRRSLSSNKKIRRMGLPDPAVHQFADQLYNGLMTQLRSVPIGMRIDRWLWDSYPDLREMQKASIVRQQQDNVQGLSPEIKAMAPTTIFNANVAMNSAYAIYADQLFGSEIYVIPYRSAGFENTGERLLEICSEVPSDASRDRELVDGWAEELEIQEWYEWVPIASEE